jgi:hypothetical protein
MIATLFKLLNALCVSHLSNWAITTQNAVHLYDAPIKTVTVNTR